MGHCGASTGSLARAWHGLTMARVIRVSGDLMLFRVLRATREPPTLHQRHRLSLSETWRLFKGMQKCQFKRALLHRTPPRSPERMKNTQAAPHIGALTICVSSFTKLAIWWKRQKFSTNQYLIVVCYITYRYNPNARKKCIKFSVIFEGQIAERNRKSNCFIFLSLCVYFIFTTLSIP